DRPAARGLRGGGGRRRNDVELREHVAEWREACGWNEEHDRGLLRSRASRGDVRATCTVRPRTSGDPGPLPPTHRFVALGPRFRGDERMARSEWLSSDSA